MQESSLRNPVSSPPGSASPMAVDNTKVSPALPMISFKHLRTAAIAAFSSMHSGITDSLVWRSPDCLAKHLKRQRKFRQSLHHAACLRAIQPGPSGTIEDA